MQKIGVVSIRPQIDPKGLAFGTVYEAFGKNTGNMMFTKAVFDHLDAELTHIGFSINAAVVNTRFDALVIPAANWLGSHAEWDWFTDQLEKVEIPVVTIGLGAQANDAAASSDQWNASSVRLAKVLASKGAYVSVRGHYTQTCLNRLGVLNVVTTGCPSLYRGFDLESDEDADGGLILQSTRYSASRAFADAASLNRDLFRMTYRHGLDMIYQSEPEEMEYALRGGDAEFLTKPHVTSALCSIYGAPSVDALRSFFDDHGHVFFDLNQWSRFVRRHNGVLGTRLHGSIVALNSGRPAVLLPHDTRTAELVDFAKIPTATLEACDWTSRPLDEFPMVQDQIGLYYDRRRANGAIYRAFLDANGLSYNSNVLD